MYQNLFDFKEDSILYFRKKLEIETPLLHCALLVKRGSLNDYIPGTAHCLEHMMIENQVIEMLDWRIINRWAHTDFYDTIFFFVVDVKNFEYVLNVIQSIINGTWLNNQEFKRIKIHVMNELKNKHQEEIKEYLLKKSIYSMKSPIGNREALVNLSFKEVECFFYDNYKIENFVFLATGDLECFESMNKERLHFSNIKLCDPLICYPLCFENDIFKLGMGNVNLYIHTQKDQSAIFGNIKNFVLNMQIIEECLNVILNKELGYDFVKCRLLKFSIGFYLFHIEIGDRSGMLGQNIEGIVEYIKRIYWHKYIDLINEIVKSFANNNYQEFGINLGEVLLEAENEILFGKNIYSNDSDAVFDAEDVVKYLNIIWLEHKYRILV